MYQLNEQQRQHYAENGYCIIPDFFSADDVSLMRHELRRLQEAGLLHNKCTAADGISPSNEIINLQICPLTPHSTVFRSLAFFKPVGDAVAELLTSPFLLQLDQIFVKPARHGYGTNWHQDNAYFHNARMAPESGVGMWIAIDDAHVGNGTMRLIPGSHRQQANHVRDYNSDHFITCADSVDESQAIAVEVPAGGVAFFNFGIIHCTRDNKSDQDRAGLALHFVEEHALSFSHGDPNPCIRGPGATKGAREYGRDLSADWVQMRRNWCQSAATVI